MTYVGFNRGNLETMFDLIIPVMTKIDRLRILLASNCSNRNSGNQQLVVSNVLFVCDILFFEKETLSKLNVQQTVRIMIQSCLETQIGHDYVRIA